VISLRNRGIEREKRRSDPVVHFYETFLHAYDPKLRELRGVYYTPEPVVNYIVESLGELLKKRGRGLPEAEQIYALRAGSPAQRFAAYSAISGHCCNGVHATGGAVKQRFCGHPSICRKQSATLPQVVRHSANGLSTS
jgi:hypothetical protein